MVKKYNNNLLSATVVVIMLYLTLIILLIVLNVNAKRDHVLIDGIAIWNNKNWKTIKTIKTGKL